MSPESNRPPVGGEAPAPHMIEVPTARLVQIRAVVAVAALTYATQLGIPVFPCGRDKKPLTKNGFKDATTDQEQIVTWWEQHPEAMIGIPTGMASGIDVLDIDYKPERNKDGFAALSELNFVWQNSSPVTVRTPSGGGHAWFRSEGKIRNTTDKIAKGVDTRGEGGYVIVPPSGTAGAFLPFYRFEVANVIQIATLPTFPAELAARLRTADQPPKPKAEHETNVDLELIAKAVAAIPNADAGWDDWNKIAMALWDWSKGSDDGFALFDGWSQKSGKYDAAVTRDKWAQLARSPPNKIGVGTIIHLANEASPIWRDVTIAQREKIEQLAALPYLQYEIQRKAVAKTFDIRVGILDQYVNRIRPPQEEEVKGQGAALTFQLLEPWPEPVAGETLVNNMTATIKKHVVLTDEQSLAVALWVLHAHAFEFADISARLHIASPAPRCGKTTLLDLISEMVPKSVRTENLSLAVTFRLIEMYQPTLLIDEADAFLKENEEMRGILNSGHRRGTQYLRIVGEDHEPRGFSVWSPVAIAGIGSLPQTIEDRSITISLRRRLKNEHIERLKRNRSHLSELGRRAARWVADNGGKLADADPALPEKLDNREEDNWRALIAIADAISTDLGKKARAAALKISEEEAAEDESASIMCLADVAAIFELKNVERLSSQTILDALLGMEDRPWKEWRRGKEMTKNSLARLLKPYNIKPHNIRFQPKPAAPVKGYDAAPILEAKTRYVDEERDLDEADIAGAPETASGEFSSGRHDPSDDPF
jgi:hypothetical protein